MVCGVIQKKRKTEFSNNGTGVDTWCRPNPAFLDLNGSVVAITVPLVVSNNALYR